MERKNEQFYSQNLPRIFFFKTRTHHIYYIFRRRFFQKNLLRCIWKNGKKLYAKSGNRIK